MPYAHSPAPLRWQADVGEPRSIMGGWFVGPDETGQAVVEYFGPDEMETTTAAYLDDLWSGSATHTAGIPRPQIKAAIAYWRPAAVVAVTAPHSPLAHVLSGFFGRPTFREGRVLAWRL